MSRETFAIEWNIARAALKGILKLHPLSGEIDDEKAMSILSELDERR